MKEFRFVLPLILALFALQAFSQNPTQTKYFLFEPNIFIGVKF